MLLADLLQALAEFRELRIPGVLPQTGDELDLHLLRLLGRIAVLEDALQNIGIEHQRLHVITHGLNMDVLVDEFDGLRSQPVPEHPAVAAHGLHGFIDLRQPLVILRVSAEARVG